MCSSDLHPWQAKPTASPLQVARSRQAHSQPKKKKNTESKIEPNQPIMSLVPGITSRHRWQRDQTPIQKQTKHRTQQTKHKAQRCLSKKKKISNTQTKIKPSKPLTHGRSRRRSELIVVVVVHLVAPHRRSKIGERRSLCLCSGARCSLLDAPSGPPSRYFALFSL